VICGGGWDSDPLSFMSVTDRIGGSPGDRGDSLGFRVVLP